MEVIFMFSAFLFFVRISSSDIDKEGIWHSILDKHRIMLFILFWVLAGFLLSIHFTTFSLLYSGPEAIDASLLGAKNILMALVPGGLIAASYLTNNKNTSVALFSLEFIIWIIIYFFVKESYDWGPYPGVIYKMYDYIALTLRLLLLMHFIDIKEHRMVISWTMAYMIISCKGSLGCVYCYG